MPFDKSNRQEGLFSNKGVQLALSHIHQCSARLKLERSITKFIISNNCSRLYVYVVKVKLSHPHRQTDTTDGLQSLCLIGKLIFLLFRVEFIFDIADLATATSF